MIGLQSNNKLTKESRLLMSAKPYTIQDLLVGKHYRSHSRHDEGVIQYATPRPEFGMVQISRLMLLRFAQQEVSKTFGQQ